MPHFGALTRVLTLRCCCFGCSAFPEVTRASEYQDVPHPRRESYDPDADACRPVPESGDGPALLVSGGNPQGTNVTVGTGSRLTSWFGYAHVRQRRRPADPHQDGLARHHAALEQPGTAHLRFAHAFDFGYFQTIAAAGGWDISADAHLRVATFMAAFRSVGWGACGGAGTYSGCVGEMPAEWLQALVFLRVWSTPMVRCTQVTEAVSVRQMIAEFICK